MTNCSGISRSLNIKTDGITGNTRGRGLNTRFSVFLQNVFVLRVNN